MLDSDTMDRYVADGKSSNGSLRGVVGISVDDVSVAESAGGEAAQVSRIDSEAIIEIGRASCRERVLRDV